MLRPAIRGKYVRAILAPFAAALSTVAVALGGYQPSPLLPLDGAYRSADGGTMSLAVEDGSLLWTDLRTGELRHLTQTSAQHFSLGPAYLVQAPVRGTVEAMSGGLTLTRDGSAPRTAERLVVRREAVTFRNGRVTLHGKVTIPPGEGRHPAVAFVFGSEAGDRDAQDLFVNFFTSLGMVVLTYDKRGVGDSGGTYLEAPTARNVADLSGDVLAGLRLLARRPDVDPARIGLEGGSQAGWIIPHAAAAAPGLVRFAVIISGPAMSVGEQAGYQGITGGGSVVPPPTAKRIRAVLSRVPPSGFDPRRDLRRLKIPVLWLFGAEDRSVYTPQSVRILRGLHKPAFAIRAFPRADHFLLESPRGLSRDVAKAKRFVPALFPGIRAWLAAKHVTG